MQIDREELEAWRQSGIGRRVLHLLRSEIEAETRLLEGAIWNPRTLSTPENVLAHRVEAEAIKAADHLLRTLFAADVEELAQRIEALDAK